MTFIVKNSRCAKMGRYAYCLRATKPFQHFSGHHKYTLLHTLGTVIFNTAQSQACQPIRQDTNVPNIVSHSHNKTNSPAVGKHHLVVYVYGIEPQCGRGIMDIDHLDPGGEHIKTADPAFNKILHCYKHNFPVNHQRLIHYLLLIQKV